MKTMMVTVMKKQLTQAASDGGLLTVIVFIITITSILFLDKFTKYIIFWNSVHTIQD